MLATKQARLVLYIVTVGLIIPSLSPAFVSEEFVIGAETLCTLIICLIISIAVRQWITNDIEIRLEPPALTLAIQRTRLAATRAVLSYLRVGLGFVSLSLFALVVFGRTQRLKTLVSCLVFAGTAMIMIAYGVCDWLGNHRRLAGPNISDIPNNNGALSEYQLAVSRTQHANIATFLTAVGVAQPLLAMMLVSLDTRWAMQGTQTRVSQMYIFVACALAVLVLLALAGWTCKSTNVQTYGPHPAATSLTLALLRTELANLQTLLNFLQLGFTFWILALTSLRDSTTHREARPSSTSVVHAMVLFVLGLSFIGVGVGLWGACRRRSRASANSNWTPHQSP